jgi:hypothetical protein
VGPFNLSVYFSFGLFVMMSWVSFFVPPVGEIKSGSVQSVGVLFLRLVCDDELGLLLRAPVGEIKSGSAQSACVLFSSSLFVIKSWI